MPFHRFPPSSFEDFSYLYFIKILCEEMKLFIFRSLICIRSGVPSALGVLFTYLETSVLDTHSSVLNRPSKRAQINESSGIT